MLFFLGYIFLKQLDLITTSFLVNGCLSIILFFDAFKTQKISMALIHYFFIFLFFVFVPIMQYNDIRFMHYDLEQKSSTLLYVNMLITCWLICFSIAYKFFQKTKYEIVVIKYKKEKLTFLYLLYIPVTIIIVWTILSGNISSLLFRGVSGVSGFENQSLSLIYGRSFKPLFLILFFYFYILRNYLNIKKSWLLFFFFIAILYNFPLNNARFFAFTIILLFYVQFIMKREQKSVMFFYYLILGVIGSDFFELFRYMSNKISDYSFSLNYFYEGHFDSYENFLHTFNYVSDYALSYGYSLFGAIFFFIPRAIWPSKPIESGWFLAQNYIDGATNLNIANSCISEYFYNFHLPGVIIAGVVYGVISSLLDKSARDFVNGVRYSIEGNLYLIPYSMLLGFFLFQLRGSMMSGTAYTFGSLFAIWFVNRSFGYRYKIIKNTRYIS